MGHHDKVVLYLSKDEADALATRIANQVFDVVHACANREYPWNGSIADSMEALGRDILERALKKFYARCS